MTDKEILERAQELVTGPGAWIRNHFAKNIDGDDVMPASDEACRFCMEGAIIRAIYELSPDTHTYFNRADKRDRICELVITNMPQDDVNTMYEAFVTDESEKPDIGYVSLINHFNDCVADQEQVIDAFESTINSLEDGNAK